MARVNPHRSLESSCRHLFRHLDDAARLRSNPIVQRFFTIGCSDIAVGQNIRSAIALVAENLAHLDRSAGRRERARRLHSIVFRCDLAGESVSAVARDLHLSRSQFYRERKATWARIAQALMVDRRADPAYAASNDELAIRHIWALWQSGSLDEAIAVAAELAANTSDPTCKIVALCKLAVLSADNGRYAHALHALDEAERLTIDVPDAAYAALRVRVSRAVACVIAGDSASLSATLGRIATPLSLTKPEGGSNGYLRFSAVMELVPLLLSSGQLNAALPLVDEVQSFIVGNALPPTAALGLCAMKMNVARARGDSLEGPIGEMERALGAAEHTGLLLSTFNGFSSLLLAYATACNYASLEKAGAYALSLGECYGNPRLTAEVHAVMAHAAWSDGKPDISSRRLEMALPHLATGTDEWFLAKITESRLAMYSGNLARAGSAMDAVLAHRWRLRYPYYQQLARTQMVALNRAGGR
jgi:tetratricopeptide (TPR) repeat protein